MSYHIFSFLFYCSSTFPFTGFDLSTNLDVLFFGVKWNFHLLKKFQHRIVHLTGGAIGGGAASCHGLGGASGQVGRSCALRTRSCQGAAAWEVCGFSTGGCLGMKHGGCVQKMSKIVCFPPEIMVLGWGVFLSYGPMPHCCKMAGIQFILRTLPSYLTFSPGFKSTKVPYTELPLLMMQQSDGFVRPPLFQHDWCTSSFEQATI